MAEPTREDEVTTTQEGGDSAKTAVASLTTAASAGVVAVTSSQSALLSTPRRGPLIPLTPMERRLIMGATRVGVTIADGLLLSSTVLNPVITVAFVAYESIRSIHDYYRGELNTLGYRTSLSDVSLRIGKEVGTAAIGIGIGHAVGTLIGLSAIPVAGQIATATVISVVLGICVGTLLTRYADRLFIRLQLQTQYGYSPDEEKARKRFEKLLESEHDLSSFAVCRIVQHYRDYRVACGWESHTDVDDYRATGDITMMPVSFQHFAIIQLQRKWGFLNGRSECKKVYKALMLLHHPDKGGDTELAAHLNHDFEIYAFCQGWQEDCPTINQAEVSGNQGKTSTNTFKKRKKNVVVDFLRSLFRQTSNSTVEAEDLRQYGLLALEAGTPLELHRFDELNWDTIDKEEEEEEEEEGLNGNPLFGTSASVKQRSVARVLASIQRCYQLATEATTFSGLVHIYREREQWSRLRHDVFMFNRLQMFVNIAEEMNLFYTPNSSSKSCHYYSSHNFRWCTRDEAVAEREERRKSIVSLCFSESVSSKLTEALELWRTAQGLAESFFKQSSTSDAEAAEGTGQTLDTLLNIQKALQEITESCTNSWKHSYCSIEDYKELLFVEEVRALGLTASCALAGAHAITIHDKMRKNCEDYYRGRERKMQTVTSLLNELHEIQSDLAKATIDERDILQKRYNDYLDELYFVHRVFSEVDSITSELYDMYTMYLPENFSLLKELPSSCARCVYETLKLPRFVKYERERTLMNYINLEIEPRNAMDCSRYSLNEETSLESVNNEVKEVEFALLRAQYMDPISGTLTPCWLKRYIFPKSDTIESKNDNTELFKHIMKDELHIPESCASKNVTYVSDVFCDNYTQQIYFHIPRGGTQLRFSSTHDVSKRIMRLGVRWLHDALQSIIEIHSCLLVHGSICLANFTYDDFGNTTLGFFSNSVGNSLRDTLTPLDDVIDFGACLHAEVIPYLQGVISGSNVARFSPTATKFDENFPAAEEWKQKQQEIINVYREVADRLIGKIEPRWTLLDARGFVRRFLQFNYDSDERNYLFTKEIAYPAYWAIYKSIAPHSLVSGHHVFPNLPKGISVFLNRNVHLWELYWKCRRKMLQLRGGSFFSLPAEVKGRKPFLPCTDECEVNEWFLWHTCRDEEETWQVCIEGISSASVQLCFTPPWMREEEKKSTGKNEGSGSTIWGVVFRVSLGTVLESDEKTMSEEDGGAQRFASSLAYDLEHSAKQKCVLAKGNVTDVNSSPDVLVPSPNARCYPEFMIGIPVSQAVVASSPI
ncbi:uncharacterized protein TM35_000034530 [Trypanosoma theileri]|uniref:Transferase n=1 Tax=Trypanosoma theileri TaxID=67003 RepID=A0A1X0P8E2_9TRYP|nr:uncharacterized protein TM35_000034530 [Trypanosoma theileri]ORC92700.1 hypothetical protein TM35_000034530 [Trypanosoma theileri]